MKNFMRVVLVGIIAVILLGLAGCGKGSDAKALAKQSYDMFMSMSLDGDEKTEEQKAQDEELGKKIAALSEADQKIYQEELQRLMADALGGLKDMKDSADDDDSDDEKEDTDGK